jgi:16S rRNA (guanine527-N7)-methyltransferase
LQRFGVAALLAGIQENGNLVDPWMQTATSFSRLVSMSIPEQAATSHTLAEALAKREIQLPDDQVERLDGYCRLLWQWNDRLNLTRHDDFDKFVSRDVVDAMQLERFVLSGDRTLDVGSGGGLSGVVLGIIRPDVEMTLTESVAKKARALAEMVSELDLPMAVVHGRAESMLADQHYDTLVARAVAPLWKLLTWFQPHWDSIGQLLVVKGPSWSDERAAARERQLLHEISLRKTAEYAIPDTGATSVILRLAPEE